MTVHSQESELIAAARKGDLEAFNQLVLAYQNLLYTQAYRLLGDGQLADDATQEAFIKSYQKLSTYRGGSFKVWLLRIVTNVCYDELRRRKRNQTVPLEPFDAQGNEFDSPYWLVDPGLSPEELVEQAEMRAGLQKLLDQLPVNYRSIIVLVDIQGLDYSEAAAALGIAIGTVKSRLARARERMRQYLIRAQDGRISSSVDSGLIKI
ncbi:MAG TPA: sigma-70 family RNA polymerase sigma factor [Anaerolineales bacterium]